MSEQEVLMTLESLRQKEEELELLKTVRRKEVAARIKQAIEFGDISENSEYEDAKNEQAFIEGTIINLENMLRHVRVIDSDNLSNEIISEYSIVEILNLDSNQTMKFQIVGSVEANPLKVRFLTIARLAQLCWVMLWEMNLRWLSQLEPRILKFYLLKNSQAQYVFRSPF